jgi:hypothetical protein
MTQEALKLALEEIQKYEKETGEKLTLRANKLVLEPDELTIAYMSGYHKGVAVEREACAKILETTDLGGLKDQPAIQDWVALMLMAYVDAIRARGQA